MNSKSVAGITASPSRERASITDNTNAVKIRSITGIPRQEKKGTVPRKAAMRAKISRRDHQKFKITASVKVHLP
jgi:hypothetical protein